ncbi:MULTISPECIES: YetF domain-containing protein [unclassified Arthrobacter]|uniref:DUF421 domain-containing protein n=1 Tax=unclassified Arthrobacter TaxID=235627 RepID=UPI0002FE3957|nr:MULTISPECIES: YetF domain-containing protein [unclassified Arthrobacter]PVE19907.1 DUF421 domain-containing protein [Arthrobacter sp. Bz4]
MWFESWDQIIRVLIIGSVSYAALVVLLRASGKRTLSQLNAFDFIVTVALGSTLATILLSAEVSFAQGLTALVLLASLQLVVAAMSARWPRIRSLVTAKPVALVLGGQLQADELRRNRLTESEVRQAIRTAGSGDLSDIAAVILETNGTLSVIPTDKIGSGSALDEVTNWPGAGTP